MIEKVDIEVLESYLAGDIGADQVFDKEGNAFSKESLDLAIKEYHDTVVHLEGAALKIQLMEMQSSMTAQPQKSSFKVWYAAAAAILLLLTAGLLWQNENRAPSFKFYFDHFDQLVSFRNDTENSSAEGIEAYSRENYAKAFDLLNDVSAAELDDELKFYLGVSALGSEHVVEAIGVFEGLGMDRSNKYYQQTRWYLALAYWQADEVNKTIGLLQSIENGEYKFKEAELLKRALD